jgi:ABC-2 type transport system ATP-binding protein
MPLLALHDIGHAYGSRRVLNGLSLEVERGEILGLLGPNGCGKSTLLGLLFGTLPLREGTLSFEGAPVRPTSAVWRRVMGVVFQSPSLDGLLTADENLRIAAALHGHFGADARRRADEALELVGMRANRGQRVATMSGGMRRRVDIARALLTSPEVLVMDEPSGGLDEASFRQLWERLLDINRARGLTIVLSTHRPDEASFCHRVAVLDEGRIVLTGTPESLRASLGSEIIVVETDAPDAVSHAAVEMGLTATRQGAHSVVIACEQAAPYVPRLFELVDAREIRTVSLRRPDLADAFVKITGRSLHDDVPEAA